MTLGIYCAGGFGGVTIELARELNEQAQRWDNICFIDDTGKPSLRDCAVYSYEEFCARYSPENAEIVIASGEPRGRDRLFQKVKADGFRLPNLIHPLSQFRKLDSLGEGNIVLGFAYVSSSGVRIGNNNIIMPFAQVSHDNVIGNHCVIASSSALSGTTVLEDRCYIGAGSKLREGIRVGHDAIVGMGAIVVKSVDEESVVMGIPAKEVRKNTGSVFH